jgi:hypothetical protein
MLRVSGKGPHLPKLPHRRRGSPQERNANTSKWANIAGQHTQHTPTDKDAQSIEHTSITQIDGQRTAERNNQQQNIELIQTNS